MKLQWYPGTSIPGWESLKYSTCSGTLASKLPYKTAKENFSLPFSVAHLSTLQMFAYPDLYITEQIITF